ncbi:MAG: hypothetical protein AAGI23_08795 [Bacteroidota bacterium]
MNCNITYTKEFVKDVKKLYKKYRSLKDDLDRLEKELSQNPYAGIRISDNFYKLRLAIKSKGKGKSGGGRVIYHIELEVVENEDQFEITLLKLYDKSAQENVSAKEIEGMLDRHNEEKDD